MKGTMTRMNKIYNANDKKDRFIVDRLLPYFMRYIEESDYNDEKIEKVSAMYIFPYKTEEGIRIGSLKERGVSWYFVSEGEEKRKSSGSYRVFADTLIKPEQFKRIRQIFLERGIIKEFSNEVVLKELITRMSFEKNYTQIWWNCAFDVYRLWTPDSFNVNLLEATKSINNDYFLFDDSYDGTVLKDELIRNGVFKDIVTHTSNILFWDRISEDEKKKAILVLKNLGVPCSFVYERSDWNSPGYGLPITTKKVVNERILQFAKAIGNELSFPLKHDEKEASRCRLSHKLFMDILYRESEEAFKNIADPNNEEAYNAGILVLNMNGDYVPLSWHLFYSAKEIDDVDEEETQENEEILLSDEEWKDRQVLTLEERHIDVKRYESDFIRDYDNIHEFSEVDLTAEEYGIENENIIPFYKWVWSYSKHIELATNILWHFSESDETGRYTVNKDENLFLLSVINNYDGYDAEFCFDIDLVDSVAFQYADIINKIDKVFEGVYAVVYSDNDYSKIDVKVYVRRILDATYAEYSEKSDIELDEIWEHVYLSSECKGMYDGKYFKCKIYHRDEGYYEDAIILCPSEDVDYYIRALAVFVKNHYNVDVDIAGAESFDWKEEYLKLADGMYSFISDIHIKRSLNDLGSQIANMEDVETFGEEKKIWLKLKSDREKIMEHETGSVPVNLSSWRSFLSAKYRGSCQLCGKKTITGEQYARFFTFRVVKPSQNYLADMYSNMFCLCPSCWGQMQQGDFMGKDMSELLKRTSEYTEYIEKKLRSDEMENHYPSLIKEVWERQELSEEEEKILKDFHNPIVCRVMVNGIDRCMAFSWEHFMRIAFILSDAGKIGE